MHHIDILRLRKATFGDELLGVVAHSFIAELPMWRAEFVKEFDIYNVNALADLLHKMKGCCFTISAFGVADQFRFAEENLRISTRDEWQSWSLILLSLIDQLENELKQILDKSTLD